MQRSSSGALSLARIRVFGLAIRCSGLILALTGVYLALGLLEFALWRLTGSDVWIVDYFRFPGALLLVSLATMEVLLSVRVLREFSPGQPLRTAWKLIALSSGCGLAGALCAQILSVETMLNPLVHLRWWSNANGLAMREFGLVVGGLCRFTFLAAGLFWALRAYRQSGFLARLTTGDWILLAGCGAYVVREALDLAEALGAGKHPGTAEVLGWPVDPLLWLLLAEALLLYRSVQQMGSGWIGRCWKAFSMGIFLISLGDVAIWATNYGFLPWPWSGLGWYVWIPAAAAFALAPAYQLEVIEYARSSNARPSARYGEA